MAAMIEAYAEAMEEIPTARLNEIYLRAAHNKGNSFAVNGMDMLAAWQRVWVEEFVPNMVRELKEKQHGSLQRGGEDTTGWANHGGVGSLLSFPDPHNGQG
ncbi:MAG TPA: hypothetical protein VIY48_14790 [Candidatus Paceibacterota bacterium]